MQEHKFRAWDKNCRGIKNKLIEVNRNEKNENAKRER